MVKKVAGFFAFGLVIVAVLVLVYVVVTKGYLSRGGTPTTDTATPSGSVAPIATGITTSSIMSLVITSPINNSTLDSTNATVKGKTSPKAEIFVNDQEGTADANGNFSISIGLDEGSNLITVSANDAEGNVSQQELNVTVVSFE